MSVLSDFRERYLVRFWSPLPALVALGVASAYYFAITGTFWARHRRVHSLGWTRHFLVRLHPAGVELFQADRPGRYAARSHRRRDDHRYVAWRTVRGTVGEQRQPALADQQAPPCWQGPDRRHHRRLRRASGHGLQSGGLLHRHSDVLAGMPGPSCWPPSAAPGSA